MFALLKQVRTPPVRPADGVVECVYESFVPGEDYRGFGAAGGPCRGHSVLPCAGNT